MSCTVKPCQVFECPDATHFADLQTYLDGLGYTVGAGEYATRTDDAVALTVTVAYPDWPLEV